jgi:predicted unusual protein kinase regulating ubiquinone biosynthesis (AarF/ABC1/UbiB family)
MELKFEEIYEENETNETDFETKKPIKTHLHNCEKCSVQFKSRTSLWRHKQPCVRQKLTEQTSENALQKDLDKGIIAMWHDESHLNNYFSKNIPKSLDSGYIYPESSNIPFDKKIIQLDKRLQSDFKNLRD